MKRTLFILSFIGIQFFCWGYEVGDMYIDPQTGVPSIVAYVDNTGEHGMIMSPAGGYYTENQIDEQIKEIRKTLRLEKKYIKMTQMMATKSGVDITSLDECMEQAKINCETVLEWLPNMPLSHKSKITEIKERNMLRNIAADMTGYGAIDQQMIIDYCEANNVDLQEYFYAIDWALRLGEGWFIPGNYDLEIYSQFFTPGLGVVLDTKNNNPERTTAMYEFSWKHWMLGSIYSSNYILSSTCQESPWEETDNNKSKTATIIVIGAPSEPNFKDNYYVYGLCDDLSKKFYAMIKNRQKGSAIVAFKYF